MQTLETQDFRQLASWLRSLIQSQYSLDPKLQQRGTQIVQGLEQLASFFERIAVLGEQTENLLANRMDVICPSPGLQKEFSTSRSISNLGNNISFAAVGTLEGSMAGTSAAWANEYSSASIQAGVGNAAASASASLVLRKSGVWNPSLNVQAQGQASIAAASAAYSFQGSGWSMETKGCVEAGCVYAKAQAVISPSEAVLSAAVGAAAIRGECSLSFSLLGVKITIQPSVSVFGMEAGFDYSYSSREWEIGVKGTFIAGLGCSLKVEY